MIRSSSYCTTVLRRVSIRKEVGFMTVVLILLGWLLTVKVGFVWLQKILFMSWVVTTLALLLLAVVLALEQSQLFIILICKLLLAMVVLFVEMARFLCCCVYNCDHNHVGKWWSGFVYWTLNCKELFKTHLFGHLW